MRKEMFLVFPKNYIIVLRIFNHDRYPCIMI